MSRIGKHPVAVPSGVTVALAGQTLTVSGKLGELRHTLPKEVILAQDDGAIRVQPRDDSKRARAMWGLSRTLVANMVEGVSKGFTRKLVISGVGYRAAVEGKIINLQLGYSHDVKYAVPEDIEVKCETPTAITITGVAHAQMQAPSTPEGRDMRSMPGATSNPNTALPRSPQNPTAAEAAAKAELEKKGYSGVRSLTRDAAGNWAAKAMRNNVEVAVILEPNGNVREQ